MRNGDDREREHLEAETLASIRRVAGPMLPTLPPSEFRADLIEFLAKHGRRYGIAAAPPKATLLDAKLEFDARVEELAIPQWAESLSPAQFRQLAEGTGVTQQELEIVTTHSLGRHIRRSDIPVERKLAGQYACGILTGALAEAYRY